MAHLTESDLSAVGLKDWQGAFWKVYGDKDVNMPLEVMWQRAVEDASKVAEGVRKQDPGEALPPLAHVFQWACNLISKLQCDSTLPDAFKITKFVFPLSNKYDYCFETIEDVLWWKYPRLCTHCGWEVCICQGQRFEPTELQLIKTIDVHRKRKASMPKTLDEWDNAIEEVFEGAHHSQALSDMGFHFLEEVGEVASALRRLRAAPSLTPTEILARQKNLVEEVADVMSWSFSLVHKQSLHLERGLSYYSKLPTIAGARQSPRFGMKDVLWHAYKIKGQDGIGCPVCQEPKCGPDCDSAIPQ